MKRTRLVLVASAVLGVALAGCGQSAQEKATSQVCDARADISKQVDTLSALTPTTATTDQISSSLKAIGTDLKQIANAQGDLNDERASQVKDANQQFSSTVKSTLSTVVTSTSASDAKQQLSSALSALKTSYQDTFAKVDCPS